MGENKATLGTLYDINKSAYAAMPDMDAKAFGSMTTNVGLWFSSRPERKYFMFLCRELNDYTVFHLNGTNYNLAREELIDLIKSRGACVGIEYDHAGDAYDVWVKRPIVGENGQRVEAFMYKLFPCDDFIIEI